MSVVDHARLGKTVAPLMPELQQASRGLVAPSGSDASARSRRDSTPRAAA